jgi:hypothetical protein
VALSDKGLQKDVDILDTVHQTLAGDSVLTLEVEPVCL